ncbi:MAG: hypothetical protein NUV55_05400 [Sulfuricaulis sp.]|nr:hypothetical protein [Sulfuricaulis sp.]MCR4346620.1 hypothetical protein [Sulfuricaulis sp.]
MACVSITVRHLVTSSPRRRWWWWWWWWFAIDAAAHIHEPSLLSRR